MLSLAKFRLFHPEAGKSVLSVLYNIVITTGTDVSGWYVCML